MATQSPLEDILRDLARRGEISHISLTPSQNGKLWRASFSMCSKFGISFAEDVDPARAIITALTTAKMKPAPKSKKFDDLTIDWSTGEAIDPEDPAADLM